MSYRTVKLARTPHACDHDHSHVHHTPAHSHEHSDNHGHGCCVADMVPMPVPGNAPLGAADVPTGSMLSRLYIAQMDCPTEEALIRKKLGGMTDVQGLEFNLMRRVLTVVHRIEALPAVEDAIRELGMDTSRPSDVADTTPDVQPVGKPWWPLALAGAAALGAEVTHWLGLSEWIAAALALTAIAISGIGTYHKGWIALRHGNLNINALMSIAVTGAVLIGQWPRVCKNAAEKH